MTMGTFIKLIYIYRLGKNQIDTWEALNDFIDDYTEDYWGFLQFYNNFKPNGKEIGSLC